ncbi:MAG: FtsX-like permease family protein, partial [Deltaproteobacteria bacterium]|nr:FtsX-like permease family protein [Deltaproteobacteria bacterium]
VAAPEAPPAPQVDDSAILPSDQGLAISAAVLLKEGVPLLAGREKVAAALAGAGLPLKVVDWQAASGIVGQLVLVLRLVLCVAIVIIFLVALIIINNAMLVAMMDRVPEIGTLRAIGARRPVIAWMFLLEMLVLAVIAGTIGVAAGAGFIELLARVGIPATSDVMLFFFSGPRLHPSFGWSHLVSGLLSVIAVSLLSTLQPARMAMRVQPIVAMQAAE